MSVVSSPMPQLAGQLEHGRHLVLVHDWLTGKRGGEKCLAAICRHLPKAQLLTLLHRRGSTFDEIERLSIRQSWLGQLPQSTHYYRYLLPLMPHAMESLRPPPKTQGILSFSHAVAKALPRPEGVPHVCYCFTPMRYAWGLRDAYLNSRSLSSKLKSLVLDRMQQWDAKVSSRVTKFIAISQTVADRIRNYYDRESEIIYPPVDTEYFHPESSQNHNDYYLCVSAMVPYKRLDLAVAACNRLGRRLIVIGDGPQRRQLESQAGRTVEFLGWVDDQTLRNYYRGCRALLFPGEEDFGIVPVEVQACGKPVIAYASGGATETVIGPKQLQPGTGVFFQRQSVPSLMRAMQRLEENPRLVDVEFCRENALRFQAQRFEAELLSVFVQVMQTEHATLARPQAA